jgi:hypothetical protein
MASPSGNGMVQQKDQKDQKERDIGVSYLTQSR